MNIILLLPCASLLAHDIKKAACIRIRNAERLCSLDVKLKNGAVITYSPVACHNYMFLSMECQYMFESGYSAERK